MPIATIIGSIILLGFIGGAVYLYILTKRTPRQDSQQAIDPKKHQDNREREPFDTNTGSFS